MRTVRLPIPSVHSPGQTVIPLLSGVTLTTTSSLSARALSPSSIEENQRPFSAYSAAAPITGSHIQIDATRMRAKYGYKATRTLDCHIEQIKSSQLVSFTRRTDSVTPKVLQVATCPPAPPPPKRARPAVQICIQECQKSIIARREQVACQK
jgi:hypothetical protein